MFIQALVGPDGVTSCGTNTHTYTDISTVGLTLITHFPFAKWDNAASLQCKHVHVIPLYVTWLSLRHTRTLTQGRTSHTYTTAKGSGAVVGHCYEETGCVKLSEPEKQFVQTSCWLPL